MTSSKVFYVEPDNSSSPVVLRSATSGFLEQQERDPSPPSVTFGSASHPVLSHAPLRIGCCALGFAACTRATVIVPGTTGRSSPGQSAKVQFVLQIKRAKGVSHVGPLLRDVSNRLQLFCWLSNKSCYLNTRWWQKAFSEWICGFVLIG